MKIKWALIDEKTGNHVTVGEVFEIVDIETFKEMFRLQENISYCEAKILFGEIDSIQNLAGIINARGPAQ